MQKDNEPTLRNSVEQFRAEAAFKAARAGMGNKNQANEYLAFVNELPMLIKTNSLGAALAFAAYKNNASKTVLAQVSDWLTHEDNVLAMELRDKRGLVEALTTLDSSNYRALTIEVLAYLIWLRRFAKALVK